MPAPPSRWSIKAAPRCAPRYRYIDAAGNTDNDTIAARNVGGVLKLTGNTNSYSASVRPYCEDRELLNTLAFSSYTTGYNVFIDNRVDGTGNPVFSKVLVTLPTGAVRTFRPQPGLSFLALTQDDGVTLTGTSVLRLRGEYQNGATPGNVVQTYRTLSRAETIGEIKLRAFVTPTAAMRSELIARARPMASSPSARPARPIRTTSISVPAATWMAGRCFELWARSSRQVEVSKKAGLYKIQ